MSSRFLQAVLIAAAASFLSGLTASPALARLPKMNHSHAKSGQIDIVYPSKIENGPKLQPGTYKVELANNSSSPEVMFYQNGKLVAQVPAKLINNGKKSDETEVYYNTARSEHVITQIDLRGWTRQLMFNSPHTTSAGG